MKYQAKIFYATVDYDTVNSKGWDATPQTRAYSRVHVFPKMIDFYRAERFSVYEEAAVIDDLYIDDANGIAVVNADKEAAECCFVMLQNREQPWSEHDDIQCKTDFPRSMSVGDIVELTREDGSTVKYGCASVGFIILSL